MPDPSRHAGVLNPGATGRVRFDPWRPPVAALAFEAYGAGMRAGRVATIVVSALAAACLLPALDGLMGADGRDGGAGDAAADASSADASADSLPGNDASDAATLDASDASFCATHDATFCADFDESSDAGTGFSSIYLNDGGTVERDLTSFASAPASLAAGNAPLATGVTAHGAVVRNTGVTATNGVTVEVDIRIEKLASQGTVLEALAIVFGAATKCSLQLNLKASASELGAEIFGVDGGKTYVPYAFPAPLATGTWLHLTFAVAFSPSRTITVSVGKTVVINAAPMNAAFASGAVDLFLGNAYSPGPSDGALVRYDNALLSVF